MINWENALKNNDKILKQLAIIYLDVDVIILLNNVSFILCIVL